MLKHLKYRKEFELLFKSNYTRLYFFALNLVNNQEEAKDIVSSAFEHLWNNYDSLRSSMSLTPLLYTLVHNKCIDYMRHQETVSKYHRFVYLEGILCEEYVYNEHDEQIIKLRNIIQRLPEQTRRIVQKCFLEGKKYKEVANEMDISVNTVKTHVMKAFRIFRTEFKRLM